MLIALIFFICAVIIGLMFLFFGYPFFRILLPIWAFFVGIFFGINGLDALMGGGVISTSLGLVIGFFIGLVLAAIAYMVYSIAVYLFAITTGYVLGSGLMMALGLGNGFLTAVVGIVAAVALVVLFAAASMPKTLVIFVTAAAGAMGTLMGVFVLFGMVPDVVSSLGLATYIVAGSWFWMIIWAVLAAFGIAFQFGISGMAGDLSAESMHRSRKKSKK